MKMNLGRGDLFINGEWAGSVDAAEVDIIPHPSFLGRQEEWPDGIIEDVLDADVIE